MPIYVDLHIHSQRSRDSQCSVKQISTRCYEIGLAGYSITDHDTLTKVSSPHGDIIAIPGMEITSLEGHILGIGVNEQIPENLMASETVDLIHDQGALAIASHPFSSNEEFPGIGDLVYELELDGLEVTNPKKHINNRLARKVASSTGIPKVGGSDAHELDSVGIGVTVLQENIHSVDDFLNQVRKGKTDGLLRKR
jgi:predicted metal-dependent phosphoesterase TrpH